MDCRRSATSAACLITRSVAILDWLPSPSPIDVRPMVHAAIRESQEPRPPAWRRFNGAAETAGRIVRWLDWPIEAAVVAIVTVVAVLALAST